MHVTVLILYYIYILLNRHAYTRTDMGTFSAGNEADHILVSYPDRNPVYSLSARLTTPLHGRAYE